MELWKVSVHLFNGEEEEFISERALVREWLSWRIRRASCGVVYVKNVKSAKGLRWSEKDTRYVFYRRYQGKIVWEEWRQQLQFPY